MLRGTKVRVNGNEFNSGRKICRNPEHLIGKTGIAIERMNSGYIKVLTVDEEGYLIDHCYPEDTLDVIEPPVEL